MIKVSQLGGNAALISFDLSRLDAAVAGELKDALNEVTANGTRRLVLDFSGIDFLDSSGLGALVGCKKAMGATGRIEIACPNDKVLKVLKLTRMTQVFAVTSELPLAC